MAEVTNNNGRHSPRDGRRPGDRLNRPVTVVRRNGVQCPSNPTAERASNASQQTSQETHSTGSRGISRGNSSSASAVPIHDSTNTVSHFFGHAVFLIISLSMLNVLVYCLASSKYGTDILQGNWTTQPNH